MCRDVITQILKVWQVSASSIRGIIVAVTVADKQIESLTAWHREFDLCELSVRHSIVFNYICKVAAGRCARFLTLNCEADCSGEVFCCVRYENVALEVVGL